MKDYLNSPEQEEGKQLSLSLSVSLSVVYTPGVYALYSYYS